MQAAIGQLKPGQQALLEIAEVQHPDDPITKVVTVARISSGNASIIVRAKSDHGESIKLRLPEPGFLIYKLVPYEDSPSTAVDNMNSLRSFSAAPVSTPGSYYTAGTPMETSTAYSSSVNRAPSRDAVAAVRSASAYAVENTISKVSAAPAVTHHYQTKSSSVLSDSAARVHHTDIPRTRVGYSTYDSDFEAAAWRTYQTSVERSRINQESRSSSAYTKPTSNSNWNTVYGASNTGTQSYAASAVDTNMRDRSRSAVSLGNGYTSSYATSTVVPPSRTYTASPSQTTTVYYTSPNNRLSSENRVTYPSSTVYSNSPSKAQVVRGDTTYVSNKYLTTEPTTLATYGESSAIVAQRLSGTGNSRLIRTTTYLPGKSPRTVWHNDSSTPPQGTTGAISSMMTSTVTNAVNTHPRSNDTTYYHSPYRKSVTTEPDYTRGVVTAPQYTRTSFGEATIAKPTVSTTGTASTSIFSYPSSNSTTNTYTRTNGATTLNQPNHEWRGTSPSVYVSQNNGYRIKENEIQVVSTTMPQASPSIDTRPLPPRRVTVTKFESSV